MFSDAQRITPEFCGERISESVRACVDRRAIGGGKARAMADFARAVGMTPARVKAFYYREVRIPHMHEGLAILHICKTWLETDNRRLQSTIKNVDAIWDSFDGAKNAEKSCAENGIDMQTNRGLVARAGAVVE